MGIGKLSGTDSANVSSIDGALLSNIVSVSGADNATLITTNLQVYYDPTQSVSGTTYLDVAPDANNFDGSLLNGVDTSNSSNGYISFDGVNDELQSGTTATSGVFDLGTYHTTSGWYKLKSLQTVSMRAFNSVRFTSSVNTNGVIFDFNYANFGGVDYRRFVGFFWFDNGSGVTGARAMAIPAGTLQYTSNEWYFVTLVKDDQDYYMYVIPRSTGVTYSVNSSLVSPEFTVDTNNSDSKYMNVGAVFGAAPAHIDVGEVMFYTDAHSQSEIYNNYLATKDGYV